MRIAVPLGAMFVAGSATYVYYHMETVPVSGRRRFVNITPTWERRIGDYVYEQLMAEHKHSIVRKDHPTVAFVDRVLRRLLAAAQPELQGRHLDWEVIVIKDRRVVNAFVLPNGKVVVFSGILDVAQDEVGLATVLSHEISHVICRHGAERMSRESLLILPVLLMRLFVDNPAPFLYLKYLNTLSHSRKQEEEADSVGLVLMARSCYDPKHAITFWKRFSSLPQHGTPPEFLSTHPSSSTRISNIQARLPVLQGELDKCKHKT